MARPNIDNLRGIGDIATVLNWNVTFITMPSGIQTTTTSEDINLRCESTDLPKSTGTSTEIVIRGHKIKQPGVYTPSGQITLTTIETVDNKISSFIRAWREGCWATGTGVQKKKSEVEAVIKISRLNRQDEVIWEYTLYGAYLEDTDPGGQLQGASADPLKPTLVLSYDKFTDGPPATS